MAMIAAVVSADPSMVIKAEGIATRRIGERARRRQEPYCDQRGHRLRQHLLSSLSRRSVRTMDKG
jgi:hypothetical protein